MRGGGRREQGAGSREKGVGRREEGGGRRREEGGGRREEEGGGRREEAGGGRREEGGGRREEGGGGRGEEGGGRREEGGDKPYRVVHVPGGAPRLHHSHEAVGGQPGARARAARHLRVHRRARVHERPVFFLVGRDEGGGGGQDAGVHDNARPQLRGLRENPHHERRQPQRPGGRGDCRHLFWQCRSGE